MPKISELPLANKLKEEDYIPIVQDGVTKKVKGTHFVTEEEYSLDAFSPTITANDKAMYKFGEGDSVDFSDSAYDGAYKSAILKGNTLVNHYKIRGQEVDDEKIWANNTVSSLYSEGIYFIKNNTPHRITIGVYQIEPTIYADILYLEGDSYLKVELEDNRFFYQFLCKFNDGWTSEDDLSRAVTILQYQEGMENWDIPYFEGMQSVRMPVLTTTGKNLWRYGELGEFGVKIVQVNIPKGTYFFSGEPTMTYEQKPVVRLSDVTKQKSAHGYINSAIIADFDIAEVIFYSNGFSYADSTDKLLTLNNFMMEQGDKHSSYEPYKSNILSTPSDLELRGIGDVQDELDLLTGESISNFNIITLDGTEVWSLNGGATTETTLTFATSISDRKELTSIICTNYPVSSSFNTAIENIYGGVSLSVVVKKERLTTTDLTGFRQWLSQNPLKVQYQLATPVIKTVDLSGTPFGYKGGHIIKSSADGSLLPKFEYEVAVSRGAQISQNTSTLIKHDEKITELLKKTAATYINQKAEIAYLLNMSSTLEEAQTIPFIEDDYVNDDCMVDSDMVMDDMQVEPEKEIIDNVDTLLINLIYDLIELNDTLNLSEKVELFRQSGLIDKHNYEIIKEKLNPSFKEEDYADINQ